MINLDTRIINLLNGDELAIFCHLIKRIGKNNECFPSRELLMKETGFGRDRVANGIKSLKEKKVVESYQKKTSGGLFAKTHYRIRTKWASVFISVDGEELEEIHRDTENRGTENPLTDNPQLSINQELLSINKKKMSEIKISDVPDSLRIYFETALSFQKLFINNLKEKNAPTKNQDNAKFKAYVDPIRKMFEIDGVTKEQIKSVYSYLKSERGEFWKMNILSTSKLREKFQMVYLKSKEVVKVAGEKLNKETDKRTGTIPIG